MLKQNLIFLLLIAVLCPSCKNEQPLNNAELLKGKWICSDLKDIERYENYSGYILVFGDNNEVTSFLVDKNNNTTEESKGKYFIKGDQISLQGENGYYYNYKLSKENIVLEAKDENTKIRLVFKRSL